MSLDTQAKVDQFLQGKSLNNEVNMRMLDLVSEVGELAKEALKGTEYGQKTFVKPEQWDEEIGDVFFSLICLDNGTNVNLEEVLAETLNKYEKRFSERNRISSI